MKKNVRFLRFTFRGERYDVNEKGEIRANGLKDFSPTWIFLGGSKHHWSRRVTVTLSMAFENPHLLNGCLGWDKDHGTTRQWGGLFYGRLPRISYAHIIDQEELNELCIK